MDSIARQGVANLEVQQAARRCARGTALASAAAVAVLVQSLPFVDDPPGPEDLVRAPCETLAVGGDCDCRSVLAAALCELVGVRWRLAWIVQPNDPLDHVLLQVHVGGVWQWLDVTVPGAQVGEHPREAVARVGFGARVTGG